MIIRDRLIQQRNIIFSTIALREYRFDIVGWAALNMVDYNCLIVIVANEWCIFVPCQRQYSYGIDLRIMVIDVRKSGRE